MSDTLRKNKEISTIVKHHFPDFLVEDYPSLISFIEAYFEYLEVSGRPVDSIVNLPANRDVDATLDEFIDYLKNEFFSTLPSEVQANKRLILKHAKEFFLMKGTEKSFKFLFKILYDIDDVGFFYPSEHILRASDGQWSNHILFRGILTSGEAKDIPFKRFTNDSFSGVVDSLTVTPEKNEKILNLQFSPSSIEGTIPAEEPDLLIESGGIVIECQRIIHSHEIVNPGKGITTQNFTIQKLSEKEVSSVVNIEAKDLSDNSVKGIRVIKMGIHTDSGNSFYIKITPEGTITRSSTVPAFDPSDFVVLFNTGFSYNDRGYFKNNRGFLSDTIVLQDNYYWQQFSYVLRVEKTINQWRDYVKKIVHPSGMIVFGENTIYSQANQENDLGIDLSNIHLSITRNLPLDSSISAGEMALVISPHSKRNLFRDGDDLSKYWYRYEYWRQANGIQPDGRYIISEFSVEHVDYLVDEETYETTDSGPYQVQGVDIEAQTTVGNAENVLVEGVIGDYPDFLKLGEDSFIRKFSASEPSLSGIVPLSDGTIALQDSGSGSPSFSRNSTAFNLDFNGELVSCAVDEHRIEGARRVSEGVWSWKDGSDDPIHPTKSIGNQLVFDFYGKRENETAYSIGDKVHTKVNGLGYWYECTVGGTTDTSQPVMPTSAGTVTDGTVEWTFGGMYRIRGLLLEPSRTNYSLYSSEFDNADWNIAGATITPNATTAPDGTNTADLLTEDSSASTHVVARPNTLFGANDVYTISCYVKDNTSGTAYLSSSGGVRFAIGYDFATGEIITNDHEDLTLVDYGVEPIGNGWFRMWVSGYYSYDFNASPRINPGITLSYTGNGTDSIYIWGFQIEDGISPSSLIQTQGSTVERVTEEGQLVFDNTGFVNLSNYNGTILQHVDLGFGMSGEFRAFEGSEFDVPMTYNPFNVSVGFDPEGYKFLYKKLEDSYDDIILIEGAGETFEVEETIAIGGGLQSGPIYISNLLFYKSNLEEWWMKKHL